MLVTGKIAVLFILALLSLTSIVITSPGNAAGSTDQMDNFSVAFQRFLGTPLYQHSWWGLLVEDLETGRIIYALNPDKMFVPGSTTKLYTTAAALDSLGKDYRFKTPIYVRGEVDSSGVLHGDLILVASGDLTMGGRTTPDGRIAFTNVDHGDANALGNATLTEEDPLAGLDNLSEQISASGIKRVLGDVIVDDRLFDITASPNPSEDYIITPIMINDNLIDLSIKPSKQGKIAEVDWRPKTAMYQVQSEVMTVKPGEPSQINIVSNGTGTITLKGQIAAGNGTLVRTQQVEDPASFARSLLIESLKRNNVSINASLNASNPSDELPPSEDYSGFKRVALLTSPPFSENIKLILKVSQNMQADTLVSLMAVKHGNRSFEKGLMSERPFFQKANVDLNAISLADGRGGVWSDLISPNGTLQLLHYMYNSSDFQVYKDALPILGVDGSLADAGKGSSAEGKVWAKTGTVVIYDRVNDRLITSSKALAGYMNSSKGRNLAFVVYVNIVPAKDIDSVIQVGNDLGSIADLIYQKF